MNNPLLYSDPSGEFIWFLPVAWAAAHVFWATVITGAVIGAAIGASMYAIQAQISGNWSWGGFGKSILMGSVTGAVSAGLGQVFTAGGFWATVGNGALAGAGSGGVTSIINGSNFLEGLTKGAVIGGAVAGITYSIQSLAYSKSNTGKGLTAKDVKTEISYDPSVSNEEMSCNISQTEGELFTSKDNFGVGKQGLGKSTNGYLDMGENGSKKFLAYTKERNFWTGKSDIVYSPRISQNKYLLKFAMLHETGHAYSNMLFLPDLKIKITDLYDDTSEHLALGFLEHDAANINNLDFRPNNYFISNETLGNTLKQLTNEQLNAFNRAYNAFQPIFKRKISFP